MLKGAAKHGRREVGLDRYPGAVGPLGTVVWILSSHALRPSIHSLAVKRDQQYAAAIGASEAGFEKVNERHFDFAEGKGFDFHL